MWEDPIVEEIRRNFDEYSQKFNYDYKAIMADIRRRERESGHPMVTLEERLKALEKNKSNCD